MKKLMVLFIAMGIAASGFAATSYRDFKDAKGRVIRGKILRYDARSQKVTIERDNRKIATVPLSVFSAADQTYVKEWNAAKDFMSESTFKIEAKRVEIKDKRNSDADYNSTRKVENCGYKIELNNKSNAKLEKLKMEYCIFYEQEVGKDNKEGVRYGTLEVPDLRAKSKKELMTETVKVYKEELDSDWYYGSGQKNTQRGEVNGIWLRVSMTLPSGGEVSRDFGLPDSISNNRKWTTSSVSVGMN